MYLRCPECKTRYEISPTSIPEGGARVRCPRCRTVFGVARPASARPLVGASAEAGPFDDPAFPSAELAPARENSTLAAGVRRADAAASDSAGMFDAIEEEDEEYHEAEPDDEPEKAPEPLPRANGHGLASAAPEGMPAAARLGLPAVDAAPSPARRPRLPGAGGRPMPPAANTVVPGAPVDADVARRIARALVSEVLLARREVRNEALREGRLLARLGPAILEAWDRYRERVGTPIAEGTRFFQEAVNDILGEGQTLI